MLFRAILWLVGAVVAISALRSLIGFVARLFSDFAVPSGAPPKPQTTAAPRSESLKQDPVCGTFIVPSTAVEKTIGGTKYYFCSTDCRDKFKAA